MNALILSNGSSSIPSSQIYPFYFYKKDLNEKFGLRFNEISLDLFLSGKVTINERYDLIFIQTNFQGLDELMLTHIFNKINEIRDNAKIVYLDWFAPLHIPYPEFLTFVDLYVKKNMYRDIDQYKQMIPGETPQIKYYSEKYGLEALKTNKPVPEEHIKKIILGWNFITHKIFCNFSAYSGGLSFLRKFIPKSIDIHCRMAVTGAPWYEKQRGECLETIKRLNDKYKLISTGDAVNYKKFLYEMASSKIIISPWGYGEVCWRDFEAIICAGLLVKPSMDHLVTEPDIFTKGSYVAVKPDFSDMNEKCEYYLINSKERIKIIANAYQIFSEYFEKKRFISQIEDILSRLQLI